MAFLQVPPKLVAFQGVVYRYWSGLIRRS